MASRTKLLALRVLCACLATCAGCRAGGAPEDEAVGTIRLWTTTSAEESGLLAELLPAFQKATGIKVEVTARGTGAALKAGRDGKADVILVHSREQENEFLLDGYGLNRTDVMYNDYVILGPPGDPARIAGGRDAPAALKKIVESNSPFVSRGNKSGTHIREMSLSVLAQTEWPRNVQTTRKGMLETLKIADQERAYVLSDRSTYLFNRRDLKNLVIMVEGDQRLDNPYAVIAVNPVRNPDVNFAAAMAFVDFLVSAEAKEIIVRHGADESGVPLFTPVLDQE